MSDNPKNKDKDLLPGDTSDDVIKSRRVEMYRMYLAGKTTQAIAKAFDIHVTYVCRLAKEDGWKDRRNIAISKAFNALDLAYKTNILKIAKFFNKDVMSIIERCERTSRDPTEEERKYLLQVFDRTVKEHRLTNNEPTDITETNGKIQHVLELPEGVKYFGVIPPLQADTIITTSTPVQDTEEVPKTNAAYEEAEVEDE